MIEPFNAICASHRWVFINDPFAVTSKEKSEILMPKLPSF